ncbi:TRPM8 channel-associated factor homolog [Colossoma macropomum]|uniref:TRPM8 channel-associated factor homolog n=1 Tax=Colossoma macropomum TaxID=42526 RepID=UPI001865222F|nr:TRPM8 channel-associated factor homolog [Colossoma macropomum]
MVYVLFFFLRKGKNFKDHLEFLLQGVTEFDIQGKVLPSEIFEHGSSAFPIGLTPDGKTFLAGACYSQGRVIVAGHEAYLGSESLSTFMINAVQWLDKGRKGVIGVLPELKDTYGLLSKSGLQCQLTGFKEDLSVFVCTSYNDAQCNEIQEFVAGGGGLLIGGQAWSWAYQNPGLNVMTECPGNRILGKMGLCLLDKTVEAELYKAPHVFQDDIEFLLQGISEFDIQGKVVPSEVLVHGPLAFPIGLTPDRKAFLAGTYFGQGQVIVASHKTYLSHESLSTFMINAVQWLDKGRNGLIGVLPELKEAYYLLNKSGLQCQLTGFRKDLSVFVCTSYNDAQCREIQEFVAGGGGLLIGGQAWSWAHSNPGCNVKIDFPGNRILGKMGLYLIGSTVKAGLYKAPRLFNYALEFLLQGVSELDIQGKAVPSEVLVHGPLAFPIGFTTDEKAFLAGAYYGKGRVIVASHEAYLGCESLSTFMINAVYWLDKKPNGVIGVVPELKEVYSLLNKSGLQCQLTGFKEDLSVFVCTSYSDAQSKEIHEFVTGGGGLLIGGQAWSWAHSNPGRNVKIDFPGNRILDKMGLCLLDKTLTAGVYKAPQVKQHGISSTQMYDFQDLLQHFAQHVLQGKQLEDYKQQFLKKLGNDCVSYLRMQAYNCDMYKSVVVLLTDMIKAGFPQVSPTRPVESAKDHLLLQVGTELFRLSKDTSELLSYLIADIPNLPSVSDARVWISASTADDKEWISTGLYLSPGMKTKITVPRTIVGKGWQVQIGCQTDDLNKADKLKRAPVVFVRYPLEKENLQVWNLWGGLIYLIAPPRSTAHKMEVVIQTAIKAPYYKSGETSVSDWVAKIRKAPAPWAELEFENLIITLPSEQIRQLDHPDKVAALWDSIMRGVADLAAKPAKFSRKERFVADVQISAGFMHSGYPIMMQTQSATDLVNPYVAGKSDLWGHLHELGHNQQCSKWEFPPHTVECTCNLWPVYVHEVVLGVNRANAHGAMAADKRLSRIKKYITEGRRLENWNIWTALETYLQLQEKFGWDAFKKVFAAYRDMNNIPKDNSGKMNLYAETFSKVVGRNLVSFFKAWGWPIQPSTEEKLSSLPKWTDHPLVQYE